MPNYRSRDPGNEAERLRADESRRLQEREVEGHVQAIQGVRADIETKLRDLVGHCERLHQATRRLDAGDGPAARYRVYGTAHSRLAAALGQGLRRAQATDRLLDARRESGRERERHEQERVAEERVQAAVRQVIDLQLPRENDFETLFGGEVADAS